MKNDSILPERCKTLKNLRKENHKTQREMAELLNVTEKTYRSWENGEYRKKNDKSRSTVLVYPQPDLEKVIAIAEEFNCSVDYVLGRSDCKSVENDVISKETGLSDTAINALKYNLLLQNNDIIESINLLICDTRYRPSIKSTRSFIGLFTNYMAFSGDEQKKYSLNQYGDISAAKPRTIIDGKAFYPSEKIYFSSKQLEQMYIMEMEDIIKTLKQDKFYETQDN